MKEQQYSVIGIYEQSAQVEQRDVFGQSCQGVELGDGRRKKKAFLPNHVPQESHGLNTSPVHNKLRFPNKQFQIFLKRQIPDFDFKALKTSVFPQCSPFQFFPTCWYFLKIFGYIEKVRQNFKILSKQMIEELEQSQKQHKLKSIQFIKKMYHDIDMLQVYLADESDEKKKKIEKNLQRIKRCVRKIQN